MRLEIRKLKNKISGIVSPTPIVPPYTIIFDLGEYCGYCSCMLP